MVLLFGVSSHVLASPSGRIRLYSVLRFPRLLGTTELKALTGSISDSSLAIVSKAAIFLSDIPETSWYSAQSCACLLSSWFSIALVHSGISLSSEIGRLISASKLLSTKAST